MTIPICRQSAHRWRWGCQPYAPAALYPPGRFLVPIAVRGCVDFFSCNILWPPVQCFLFRSEILCSKRPDGKHALSVYVRRLPFVGEWAFGVWCAWGVCYQPKASTAKLQTTRKNATSRQWMCIKVLSHTWMLSYRKWFLYLLSSFVIISHPVIARYIEVADHIRMLRPWFR
jgi:hypothetical protein